MLSVVHLEGFENHLLHTVVIEIEDLSHLLTFFAEDEIALNFTNVDSQDCRCDDRVEGLNLLKVLDIDLLNLAGFLGNPEVWKHPILLSVCIENLIYEPRVQRSSLQTP